MSLKNDYFLEKIKKDTARRMVEKYHYSGVLGPCSFALGVYRHKEDGWFTGAKDLVGCLCYGRPIARLAVQSIAEDLEAFQTLELTRLFIHDDHPKNIESFSIGQSFEWIREHRPEVEILLSYSDPSQGHLGTIYQATNWMYQGAGFSIMERFRLSLTNDPYDWIHHRTIYDLYGTVNLDVLRRKINHSFWIQNESNKHRYIYILKNKKKWMKKLKYPILDYPKELDHDAQEIQEITL
jgi:hypothetical protein